MTVQVNSEKCNSFRNQLHIELDQWIDILSDVFDDNQLPTMMDLSDLFSRTKKQFLGSCLQKLIENKYSEYITEDISSCPICGNLCKKRDDHSKQYNTMQGPGKIIRPWFYCNNCLHGFHPLDRILEISRKKHQFDIQKQAVKLSARVPFQESSEIFNDLTSQKIGNHFIHNIFESIGQESKIEDILPEKSDIDDKIEKASTKKWRPILVVASDGAHTPTRKKAKRSEKRGKGRWREAKGFRIYLLNNKRIVQVASWHQVQKEYKFGKDLKKIAFRIPQDKVRIALLGDGADWLWKHMCKYFPKGRQVLDYYHCSEHIHKVGKEQYGEKNKECFQWIESAMCRLFYGEVNSVVWGLQRMKPSNETAEEEIRKLIGYLKNNKDKIDYRSARNGGYPIGSGGIESANKFICHTRMKRSGAWWVKETGNAMLRIRCSIYNNTYNKLFEKYKAKKFFLS